MHLRRFANEDGQLIRVVLPGHHRHPISVNDATVENDFYTAVLEDGSSSDAAEDLFGRVESATAAALKRVVEQRIWPISGETREALALWTALQFLRSPAARKQKEEVIDAVLAAHLDHAGAVPETKREQDLLSDAEYRGRILRNEHLAGVFRLLPDAARGMMARGWWVVRFQRRSLMTSDSPVIPLAHPADRMRRAGFESADSIYVPLDRRAGLVMRGFRAPDREVPGTSKWALDMNYEVARNARRCVFHHPEHDISGVPLPPPRDHEVENIDEQVRDTRRNFIIEPGG